MRFPSLASPLILLPMLLGCGVEGDPCTAAADHLQACLNLAAQSANVQVCDPNTAETVAAMSCGEIEQALVGRADGAVARFVCELTGQFCSAATPSACGNGVCFGAEDGFSCPSDCGCAAFECPMGSDYPTAGGCFCDPGCLEMGDCCPDACDACGTC